MDKIQLLVKDMIKYNSNDPKRIQHALKVLQFSETIGVLEALPDNTLTVLRAAAVLHDIGIRYCEKEYGICDGRLQEQEGPRIAREILLRHNFSDKEIERICYLIGHHHTYNKVDGLDYQILIEADFLVNLYEDNSSEDAIKSVYNKIFKTDAGKDIFKNMFLCQ